MRAYKARSNGEDKLHYQYFFGTARLNCTYPLKVFVLQGIHINTQVNGHFLLLDASRADNKYMVQFLFMCQFPINTQNDNGLTSLHGASYEGHENIVKLLLSHKADPNIKDNDGNTPLMIASLQGHTSIVELLTVAGAH
jgi:ankyrin repeat protein